MNKILTDRRNEGRTRAQFNKAFDDLSLLLQGYSKADHFGVSLSYLRAYSLLKGKDGVRGRLLIKLGVLI